MKHYKIVISYDGTDFFGWQSQKHCNTVQTTLKDCFLSAFAKPCTIFAASRTDTGVHANFQVASLKTTVDLPAEKLLAIFNASLPDSIKLESCEKVDETFNPHANIDYKIYVYRFFLSKPHPQVARFGWYPPAIHKVNWSKFFSAMQLFVGEYNFTAFCRLEPGEVKQTVRSVDSVICNTDNPSQITVKIQAHSFLRYQIRRMVGAAFEVSRKRHFEQNAIAQALATGEPLPPQIAFNAPASGLCLEKIVYQKSAAPE